MVERVQHTFGHIGSLLQSFGDLSVQGGKAGFMEHVCAHMKQNDFAFWWESG